MEDPRGAPFLYPDGEPEEVILRRVNFVPTLRPALRWVERTGEAHAPAQRRLQADPVYEDEGPVIKIAAMSRSPAGKHVRASCSIESGSRQCRVVAEVEGVMWLLTSVPTDASHGDPRGRNGSSAGNGGKARPPARPRICVKVFAADTGQVYILKGSRLTSAIEPSPFSQCYATRRDWINQDALTIEDSSLLLGDRSSPRETPGLYARLLADRGPFEGRDPFLLVYQVATGLKKWDALTRNEVVKWTRAVSWMGAVTVRHSGAPGPEQEVQELDLRVNGWWKPEKVWRRFRRDLKLDDVALALVLDESRDGGLRVTEGEMGPLALISLLNARETTPVFLDVHLNKKGSSIFDGLLRAFRPGEKAPKAKSPKLSPRDALGNKADKDSAWPAAVVATPRGGTRSTPTTPRTEEVPALDAWLSQSAEVHTRHANRPKGTGDEFA